MKILDYVKPYIDPKGIYPEFDIGLIRFVSRVSGNVICKNKLHLASIKNTKYRKRHIVDYYVQKNWIPVNTSDSMSLWYNVKFKFSGDMRKYSKCMYAELEEILERHGLSLRVIIDGCCAYVEISWKTEGVESDYEKLSLGNNDVGSVEMLRELYKRPSGFLYY